MEDHIYIAIDLKSFYASVECRERDLDPLKTNLVVADESRTQKTICLAVSPSLKAYGIPGRPRLFEVVQRVRQIKASNKDLELDYIVAPPRMALYMEYSTRIYNIYLRYVAPEDIHVYSIDEVFIDVTHYLKTYEMTASELAMKMILEVLRETGITATAGIGTNLYLCKIAMDVEAKHVSPDKNGVRIAYLDEMGYRKKLWNHRPITDFWRVGRGYAKKLEAVGLYTMGDIAKCSMGGLGDYYNEDLLYKLFGINAELLIDHAWGWEPCTMEEIKSYRPEASSIGSGQVLQCPYSFEKAKLIVREMTDLLILDLVDKRLVTDQLILTVGYDIENLKNSEIQKKYHGPVTTDGYGRKIPKHAHGTVNLKRQTSSTKLIMEGMMDLYDQIVNPELLVRRVNISVNKVIEESTIKEKEKFEQLDLFTDYEKKEKEDYVLEKELKKERKVQEAMLEIKKKYGKNAILKGNNLEKGAMTKERNAQIGGHKA
ncbi:MAG: DNA methylase [Anaerostipes sp.]|nr:DNA methylase [Anaerostipes sp.]